jgi:hypothetical protein
MDPLSVLGLAASIVQFVDFSSKVIDGARDLYHSNQGITSENSDVRLIAADLSALTSNLCARSSQPGQQRNSDQIALHGLASQCQIFSEELSAIMEKVTSRDPRSKTEALRVLMQSVRYQKQVRNLKKRLESCRGQLVARIVSMIL